MKKYKYGNKKILTSELSKVREKIITVMEAIHALSVLLSKINDNELICNGLSRILSNQTTLLYESLNMLYFQDNGIDKQKEKINEDR